MLSPTVSIADELAVRLRHLYGGRFIALYACNAPVFAADEDAADYDFIVVLRGDVDSAEEMFAMSRDVGELCLEHTCVISVFPIGEGEAAVPSSHAIAVALREATRVA